MIIVKEYGTIKVGEKFRCTVADRGTCDFGDIITVTQLAAGITNSSRDYCSVTTKETRGENGCSYACFHDQFLKVGSVKEQAYFENKHLVEKFKLDTIIYHTGADGRNLKGKPYRVMFAKTDVVVLEDTDGKCKAYSKKKILRLKQFVEIRNLTVKVYL